MRRRSSRKIIEVFALEPVRRPAARSFSEEGEILSESLVRILTGLNRDLEGLSRATMAMRPHFGENVKDGKFPHLLILSDAPETRMNRGGDFSNKRDHFVESGDGRGGFC